MAPDWSSLDNRWIIIEDGKRREVNLTVRQYSAAELSRLLTDAGLQRVDVCGSLGGAPYDNLATRLVGVAHEGEEL